MTEVRTNSDMDNCKAFQLSRQTKEIRPRVKAMVYSEVNLFGYDTIMLGSTSLEKMIMLSHRKNLLIGVENKDDPAIMEKICDRAKKKVVFFYGTKENIDDDNLPGEVITARNRSEIVTEPPT